MSSVDQNTRKYAFTLWVVLFSSIGLYYVVMQLIPPGEIRNGNTNLYLLAASALAAAFSLVARLRRQGASTAEDYRKALLIGSVLAESSALMGVLAHVLTGWPYAWTLIVMGGSAHLLQIPTDAQ